MHLAERLLRFTTVKIRPPRIGFLVLLALISSGHPPASGAERDFRELEKVIRAELQEKNTPGAVVAIVSGDRVIYEKGFGVADVESGAPVTAGMLFRSGSIGKMLTASVLLALLEENKIPTNAPLEKAAPGLAPRLSRLTFEQLLSHTAGLISSARICCAQEESALAGEVRAYRDEDYFFTEPGRIFSYANTGYILAGYAIEQLNGKPFADAMQERLFAPLGMTHTFIRPTMAMTYPHAQGHDAEGKAKPTVVRPVTNNVGDWPAGYYFTTAGDLGRLAIALMNNGKIDGKQVLAPTLFATLTKPRAEVPPSFDDPKGYWTGTTYGYGFFMHEHRGRPVAFHGGTIPGFGAFMALAPEEHFAVITITNKTALILERTTEKAMEMFLKLSPEAPSSPVEEMSLTQAEMGEIAGTYRNGLLRAELLIRDGKWHWKVSYPTTVGEGPGWEIEAPVRKIGRDRFAYNVPGSEAATAFLVLRGKDGQPEYLHWQMIALAKVTESAEK